MILYKNIISDSNSNIRLISKPVELPMSEDDKQTLIEMYEYLVMGYDEKLVEKYGIRPGVGLAAPQIDVQKQMLAILAFDEEDNEHSYLVVNPKIISESVNTMYLEGGEGCLSVPRQVQGFIHRPARIKVKCHLLDYETKELKMDQELTLKGYIAIVFQHEYDHLIGKLFYDHINKENPFYIPENSRPIKFGERD